MIKFEWDTAKAISNKKKHGVSFEEAQSVFYDEFAVQFFDEDGQFIPEWKGKSLGRPWAVRISATGDFSLSMAATRLSSGRTGPAF